MSLLLSPLARGAVIAAVIVGSFLAWLLAHDARVESRAAERVVTVVQRKADANAKTAEQVRNDVAAGKRGVPDPHRLRSVPAASRKDRAGI